MAESHTQIALPQRQKHEKLQEWFADFPEDPSSYCGRTAGWTCSSVPEQPSNTDLNNPSWFTSSHS